MISPWIVFGSSGKQNLKKQKGVNKIKMYAHVYCLSNTNVGVPTSIAQSSMNL